MAGIYNGVINGKNADFSQSASFFASESNGLINNGQLWIGSTALNAGGTHVNVGTLTSPDSSIIFGYSSPNITAVVNTTIVKDLHITPFIVSSAGLINGASYTNIQAALDAANTAGGGIVYVQPGSYTENLLLYANTEVVGTPGNSDAGTAGNTVIITGVHTPPATGSFTFANVRLVSATDIFSSAVAGSAALVIENAFIAITNGFFFNLPNWTGTFITYNIGEGSINNGMVNNTGGATCFFISATHGAGTGQTMVTSGPVIMQEVDLNCPWSANTGTTIACDYVLFTHTVTAANNSTGAFNFCRFSTGATPALTMSSSAAIKITQSTIDSSNNPAISGAGAGTLTYSDLVFLNNSAFAGTLTLATVSWRPYSIALAATDGTKVGTCNFNSAQFTVDANGFVSTSGTGIGNTITGDSGGALSPTAGNWNIFGRSGSKTSGSGSTLTINSPPFSQVGASATSVLNSGEFVTAAVTRTLPATAGLLDGDLVIYTCTTAGALVVTANTGQTIRVGTLISSSAGTATSTAIGDSLTLRFDATAVVWRCVSVIGTWLIA